MRSKIHLGSGRLRAYSTSILLLAILAIFEVSGNAQSTQTGDTNIINNPSVPIPGVGHNLIPGLNDSVNPADGTVNISIQIPVPAGRGLTLPFAIQYSSSNTSHMAGISVFLPPVEFGWTPISGFMSMAGWSYTLPSLSYAVGGRIVGTVNDDTGHPVNAYCYYTAHYLFVDPNGGSFPQNLGLMASYPYSTSGSAGLGSCASYGYDFQSTLYSYAGKYQATLSPNSVGPSPSNGDATNFSTSLFATFSDPDGTIYDFNTYSPHPTTSSGALSALPDFIEDRNGNRVNITDSISACNAAGQCSGSVGVTDTLKRNILTIDGFGSSGNTVSVAGIAKPYTINWDTPQNASYPISITAENPPGDNLCDPSSSGAQYPSFGPGISQITLPNGTSYNFEYDPAALGYVSKITYPNGGYVAYAYDVFPKMTVLDGYTGTYDAPPSSQTGCMYRYDRAALKTRTVSFDGVNVALTQSFDYDTNWSEPSGVGLWTSKVTTVTTTDAIQKISYTTTYTYSESGSFDYAPIDYAFGIEATGVVPLEQTIQYQDSSGSTLDTVTKAWLDPITLGCEMHTYPTSGGALTSGTFYWWQAVGIPSDVKEYDYGVLSASACTVTSAAPFVAPANVTPTRETVSTFQAFGASPIYYQPSTSFTLPTILDRPCKTVVMASGTEVAETDYLYDGGSSVCGAAGTPSVVAASVPTGTHDETNFSATSTNARGNATTVTKQCVGCTSSPKSSYTYDETGQVMSMTDPCGNPSCADMSGSSHKTTYSYTDKPSGGNAAGNSNAYLTQIVSPTTASGVSLQKTFSYNYSTGELTSSTDVNNNQTTNYCYLTGGCSGSTADPFNRLTETHYPDNGYTITNYYDSVPAVMTTTVATPDPTVTTVSIMDGLGHVIQTQSSYPNGADVVSSSYDGEGHVYKKYNPFLSSPAPSSTLVATPSGTPYITNHYDAMGRPVETIEEDGNTLQWCYNGVPSTPAVYCSTSHLGGMTTGTWVDSTDENKNHWQRTSDSFGRLTAVMEPNGSTASLSMETDYAYDALNNLTSVWQWGGVKGLTGARLRSFYYDSLSRLTTAVNPESGAVNYAYDANGNLSTKTDARGVGVNYTYNVLNQLLGKTYSNDSASTPSSCYQYGTSTSGNTIGRLINEWTQRASAGTTCPSSLPSAYLSLRGNIQYDPMGRVASERQYTQASQAAGTFYAPHYTYDLAGNLTSSTDGTAPAPTTATSTPSCSPTPGNTLTFVNCYDTAGRLLSLSSNWNDGGTHPLNLFSAPSYAPWGALTGAVFGNGLTLTRSYDPNRLWITGETDTGTGATGTPASATITITGAAQSH
jgi:YD repeat-containing protein